MEHLETFKIHDASLLIMRSQGTALGKSEGSMTEGGLLAISPVRQCPVKTQPIAQNNSDAQAMKMCKTGPMRLPSSLIL